MVDSSLITKLPFTPPSPSLLPVRPYSSGPVPLRPEETSSVSFGRFLQAEAPFCVTRSLRCLLKDLRAFFRVRFSHGPGLPGQVFGSRRWSLALDDAPPFLLGAVLPSPGTSEHFQAWASSFLMCEHCQERRFVSFFPPLQPHWATRVDGKIPL